MPPQKPLTPEEMRDRSSSKVKQVMDMMKVLNIRVEARQRVMENGFIDNMIFWIDDEHYAPAPIDTAAGPTGTDNV